jgi:membrane-bound serine protease (ClpP class)
MNRHWRICFLALLLPWICGLLSMPAAAQNGAPQVLEITADGPLTPSMGEYLKRGIHLAEQENAELLIFKLNTPGGSIDIMQDMVESIRSSTVPVVVYIAPRGAMAGSAGTVITLAGHASAMAPETTIGAASPVGPEGEDLGETLEAKTKNILKATVRSLSERRGQEAVNLAESAIESAAAASASEALAVGLVDFVAEDEADLLQQLDGFTVQLNSGERTLETTGASVTEVPPSLIEQILAILTNPNIVFLLLTIGVQAIIIELSSPGGWVAGFIGAVCLALAAYGLGVLSVNWFGLVFLSIAFALFILDIKAPTHGALTAAGVASLIVGSLVLFNSPASPYFQRVSVPLVVLTSIFTGGIFFAFLLFAVRAQKTPIRTGVESILGRVGTVRDALAPVGTVQLGGELWSAQAMEGEGPLKPGERVEVVRLEGNRLLVRKAD